MTLTVTKRCYSLVVGPVIELERHKVEGGDRKAETASRAIEQTDNGHLSYLKMEKLRKVFRSGLQFRKC